MNDKAWLNLLQRKCRRPECEHPANRHDIEQPYPCHDCECESFEDVQPTVPS